MKTMTIVRRNDLRLLFMALFLIGSWILTYMFHNHLGIGTVFTHLFYVPIVLSALWWGKRGVMVAVLYGLMLILSSIFVRETVETNNDYLRSMIFILVSVFVATLSETIKLREQTLRKQRQDLSDRVRELRCLLDLSAFWRNNDKPVSEMLQAVVERLPSSFRYPEITCSRLFFKGEAFQTADFKETRWKLSATILIQDRSVGVIEVCYLSKRPELDKGPFLNEEKELIDAIAVWLGEIIENMIARQSRQKINRKMKTLSAFRQIKQLITREKNSEKLASLTCTMLTETWGYDWAWICLVNESGIIDHHAESGLGSAFLPCIRAIRSGNLPGHVKTALERPGRVVATQSGLKNNAPPATLDPETGAMTIALAYDQKVYGLLSVAMQKNSIDNDNEHRLFKELASDIAFALQNSVIAQQQNRIMAVFEGLPDSLLMLDKNMNITMINGAAAAYYSITPGQGAEILNTPCYKGLLKRSSPCDRCKIATAVQQGRQTAFERSNPLFPERHEQVTTFPLGNSYGPNIDTLVHIRDITEKKRIEEQLFRADRLSSLGQLSGGIAHEIRNPLSSIQLFVDLLLNSPQYMRTDKEVEILYEIKDGVIKINRIIKGILGFAKAPLKPHKKININSTIKSVLKLWTPIIKKSGIELDLNLHHPMEPVFGESVQFNQIINNLLSNAVDAMAPGETLSISTIMGRSNLIPDRTVVFIRIADTGCGIAEENRTSIFNPFFTTKSRGTGLGLAITHKIIERHGGIITVDSTPGQGTTVVIELPLAIRQPAMDPSLLSEEGRG